VPYCIVNLGDYERLAPLIGVDFQTTGRLTGRLEYRLDHAIGLNPPWPR
jgi:hypothetical protein